MNDSKFGWIYWNKFRRNGTLARESLSDPSVKDGARSAMVFARNTDGFGNVRAGRIQKREIVRMRMGARAQRFWNLLGVLKGVR